MRPDRVVVVLGTETGVGKTHVAAALAAAARARGRRVVARKPVQSFGPEGSGAPPETDAHRLGRATGEAGHRGAEARDRGLTRCADDASGWAPGSSDAPRRGRGGHTITWRT